MSTAKRLSSVVFLVCALSGCDSATLPPAREASQQTFGTDLNRFDLQFQPVAWEPGDQLLVQTGSLEVSSTAGANGGYGLSWATGAVQKVVGLLNGHVQETLAVSAASGETPDGGSTEAGPTSVHWRRICEGSVCGEVIEYDYDLTDPSGNGTTAWTRPGGAPVTVDRVRFEFAASNTPSAPSVGRSVAITSPSSLQVVE